jgi:hypothetical protein
VAQRLHCGDYVGRWLWTRDGPNDDLLGQSLRERCCKPRALGRASVYDAFRADAARRRRARRRVPRPRTCLGVGAHTHYFEPDQQEMAWLVDYLLGSRYHPSPARRAARAVGAG